MSFETTTELMPQQVQAVAKMLPTRVGALFMEMGTGKSLALLRLAEMRQGKWDKLFWFCPVSLKTTALHQILEHTTLQAGDVAVWGDSVSTDNLPTQRIHIIGIESMSSSDRTVLAYRALVTASSFVAVDESAYIKGHRSRRTSRITDLSAHCRYRLVLTGTPFSQGVVDLFAQMRFLSPRILGYHSFHSFARNHLEFDTRKGPDGRRRQTSRIVRAHDVDILAAKVAPYVYQVRKAECLDLPEKLHTTRWCHMHPEQRQLYDQVKHRILHELEYSDWSPVRIFHLFTALQTVLCGWYTDPYHQTQETPHYRLNTLLATTQEIPQGEPVIIWAKYRRAVEQISAALAQQHGPQAVSLYYGQLTPAQRDQQVQHWRDHGGYLVATQATGGHGQTFNEAAYALFYADSFKYAERLQAEDRNHRIGQQRRTTYITIRCAESIDDRIALAMQRKGSALGAFQAEVDDARKRGLKQRAIALVSGL